MEVDVVKPAAEDPWKVKIEAAVRTLSLNYPPGPREEVDVPETGTRMHRPHLILDVPGTGTVMPMAGHVASLVDISATWHGNAPRASPSNSLN